MDINLREMGVGDLSVGKRNRAMWEAFHGRSAAYAAAWDDAVALEASLARNLWRGRTLLPGPLRSRPDGSGTGRCSPNRASRPCCAAISFSAGRGGRAMTPEFHRPVSLDRIGSHGLDLTVEANPGECAALAHG